MARLSCWHSGASRLTDLLLLCGGTGKWRFGWGGLDGFEAALLPAGADQGIDFVDGLGAVLVEVLGDA